jgi:hypothetical protein
VENVRLVRGDSWVLELAGTGDLTMEQIATTARTDLFIEVFGRELIIRPTGVIR